MYICCQCAHTLFGGCTCVAVVLICFVAVLSLQVITNSDRSSMDFETNRSFTVRCEHSQAHRPHA